MKVRTILVLLSLSLLLSLSSSRSLQQCNDAWTRHSTSTFPQGFGVNIHFTNPQPGEIKMISEAGFQWVRMDFKWDATEYSPGRYDFSAYDRLMSALQEHGMRALFILDYGNPLYDNGGPPRSEASRQAFTRWSVAAGKHFAGQGVVWEIYNEPNIEMFWPPKPKADEYISLALPVARAWRAALPNEKLIGPASSGIDLDFLEACFKAGLLEYWSAVSVHPYFRSDPEVAAAEYCRLREMISRYRKHGDEIPIVSGEWGYSSAWRGLTEDKQAEFLAREFLTNAANGIPLSVWYDWRDDGQDANEAEHHFGLVRFSYRDNADQVYEAKPAYRAARTQNALFNGFNFEKRLAASDKDDYVLSFSRAGERRIAAWTVSFNSRRINIALDAGKYTVVKHTGETIGVLTVEDRGLNVEISRAPIYLVRR